MSHTRSCYIDDMIQQWWTEWSYNESLRCRLGIKTHPISNMIFCLSDMSILLLRSHVPPPLVTWVQLSFPRHCCNWPYPGGRGRHCQSWWGRSSSCCVRRSPNARVAALSLVCNLNEHNRKKYKKPTHNFHFAKY
jgi:hypothetical protein